MPRKKNRQQDPNDSSDSGDTNVAASAPTGACKHISKAVQLGLVKKKLKNGIHTSCDACAKSSKIANIVPDDSRGKKEVVTNGSWSYWLCLTCAHVGCGRDQYKHAIAHHSTPRSEPHDLVVDIDSWIVWCYPCEQKMAMNSTKKLQECVEYIRRHIQSSSKPTVSPDTPASENSEMSSVTSTVAPGFEKDGSHNNVNALAAVNKKSMTTKKVIKPIKVRGLMNLGNTCFYNSVLQCLSVTPYLTIILERLIRSGETFMLPGDVNEEAPEVHGTLGESGQITKSLLAQLLDMKSSDLHADVLRPQKLLKQIQDAFPQFRGNEQHDAHELLRFLLEGVRADDLKRFQRVILQCHGLLGCKSDNVASDVKKRMKLYGNQLQDFILGVEGIFKGQLVSIVECQDCKHHSTRFESFLDLSLPVMEDKPLPPMRKKEQTENFATTSAPSKHQLKKQKKATRRNNKLHKNRRSEKMEGCLSTIEEPLKGSDGPESEQSDADVEDNVEQEAATRGNDKEVGESGYSSEKHHTGESDGTSPAIVTASGEAEAEAESPTAPVTASASISSEGPSPTSPRPLTQAQAEAVPSEEWSTFHTPEHDCAETVCRYSCNGNPEAESFTPIDEELRITIPESGEGSIHISPVNPSERPVSRCGFFPGETHSGGLAADFTPELETRLLSLCLDENKRAQVEVPYSPATNPSYPFSSSDQDRNRDRSDEGHIEKPELYSKEDNGFHVDGHNCNNNDGNINESSLFGNTENFKDSEKPNCAETILPPKTNGTPGATLTAGSRDEVTGWCRTLAPRQQSEEGECSIVSCLNQFTSLELMTGNNKVCCEACTQRNNKDGEGKTVYTNSTKQLLISLPPPVLILHLKRFMMDNLRFKKLQRFVSFPLDLDIAPFCSAKCKDSSVNEEPQTGVKYSLFGVVEHTGSLNTGHYMAYIKIRCDLEENDPRWTFLPTNRDFVYPRVETCANGGSRQLNDVEEKWYSISDSRVVEIAEAKVLKIQAYQLFYERIM